MPTFNSRQLIADLQKQTEDILNEAITQWQMNPTDVMLFKQDESKWSATQCLMHLNSYGNYYLPAIQKSIEDAEKKGTRETSTFRTSFIGNWFTDVMQPKGEQQTVKKMKSPKNHVPQSNENSDAIIAEFINQQEQILALLERAYTVDLRKAKTPISISRFVKLPLGDTFRFLIAHNVRHVLQARKAITSARQKQAIA